MPDTQRPRYPGVLASIGDHDSDAYVAVNDDVLCRVHMKVPGRGTAPATPDSVVEVFVQSLVTNLERG